MLSEDSSLTDISSDDDDYVSNKKAKKAKVKTTWKPKHVLKAPRVTQYSAQSLYDDILSSKIDLDPEYQRDVVWPDTKQSGLIDSLLRNFYIPPIIFAFSQTEDGEERRVCIDGKQRLTSIQSRTNLKMWYKLQPGNEGGRLLPEQYRKQFSRKQIACVEYCDINEDNEREIFQRVQLGVALTPAERLQAIPGPWTQLIRDVLNVMEEYRISDELEWAKTRGRDFQAAASSVYLMEKPDVGWPTAGSIERWLQRVTPPTKAFKERVMDAFAVFRQLVLTKKYYSVFHKPAKVSPIEFVMSVILVDKYCRERTLAQLVEGIRLMRKDVRSKHADIRANSKITKTMMSFMKDKWAAGFKKLDSSEKDALKECRANPVRPPMEKGKRKRGNSPDSDEDDGSEDERPLKSKAKTAAKVANSKPVPRSSPAMPRASAASMPTPKGSPRINVKTETTTVPDFQPARRPDRFAGLRQAKAKAMSGRQPSSALTPPPTAGQGSGTTSQQDPSLQETVSKIINNPNRGPSTQQSQQMWPPHQFAPPVGQPNTGQAMAHPPMQIPPQLTQQMHNLNMNAQGQSTMPPPPNPNVNGTAPSTGMATTDPRVNPNRSNPTTPQLNGTNGGMRPSSTDPQRLPDRPQSGPPNLPYQRSMSFSEGSGPTNAPQRRDSHDGRFDRPSQALPDGYREGGGRYSEDYSRRPPPVPRGRGPSSPGMRGQPWHPGASTRDREVLPPYGGGLSSRDRDRDRGNYNGTWVPSNGR
ncbi:uncharacterized protein FOMMEDRAFT_142422 [Fomitiporia mediterranea MF3/22]|uniref:uncharacterized protein n=1 Tax=Fomitiporia mediterranea (strain MF3/22) TaxID=694068 RepID=UPI0004408ED7|nr:uncharacterized protein FOMMEDRAFT_142422 [Fomitiporia mediterranea MF3/22]EJD00602.1 hypothetical protein FOMMEDRAFT_142422 [Fomitiporia mediterranea MF3/22]